MTNTSGARSVPIPAFACPACGHKLNAGRQVVEGEGECPKVGDLGICSYCGMPLIMDEHGNMQLCSEEEWEAAPQIFRDYCAQWRPA